MHRTIPIALATLLLLAPAAALHAGGSPEAVRAKPMTTRLSSDAASDAAQTAPAAQPQTPPADQAAAQGTPDSVPQAQPAAAEGTPLAAVDADSGSLALMIARAKNVSGTLKVKRLEAARTGYAVNEAWSKALPQLALTSSFTYMTNPPEGITISQGALGSSPTVGSEYPVSIPDQDYVLIEDTKPTYFKTSASLDQVLWTWGKIQKSIRIAELERGSAEVAVRASERELVRDLTKAYFGAILARDSLGKLRDAEALMAGIVEDQSKALEEGTITKQELLDAKAKAAQVTSQRVRAQEGLATGLDALEFYTGGRPEAAALDTAMRETAPDLDEKALVGTALGGSTELETLRIKSGEARLAEDIRTASLMGLPDFSLNVTWNLTGQDIPFVGTNWTDTWDSGFYFTIGGKVNLFDSLSSVWKLKQASSQREQAETGVRELERGMGIQVRRLVEAARNNAASVAEKRAQAELAAEQAKNATVARENEMVTRTEERGARIAAISADLAFLLARFQTEISIVDLEYATGAEFPR